MQRDWRQRTTLDGTKAAGRALKRRVRILVALKYRIGNESLRRMCGKKAVLLEEETRWQFPNKRRYKQQLHTQQLHMSTPIGSADGQNASCVKVKEPNLRYEGQINADLQHPC